MKRAFVLILIYYFCQLSTEAVQRTWTDVKGRRIVGEFQALQASGQIVLKVNGKSYAFPISRLSPQDQAYARQLAAATSVTTNSAVTQTSASRNFDWPCWRGPNQDGTSRETQLLRSWPSSGPQKLWTASNLGGGFSSVVVAGNQIFTLGDSGGATSIYCLERSTGKLSWSSPIGGGGANGTPTFDPETGLVYAISKNGSLACVRGSDGQLQWKIGFEKEFGGKMMSGWGYSESPLVDGPLVLCSPGAANAAIVAIDKRTGQTRWKSPFPADVGDKGKDGAGYGSIAIVNASGSRQYVQMTGRGLISADAQTGKPLWHYNRIANGTANIPSPVVFGDRIFTSTGYGDGGSALLQVTRSGVRELKYWNAKELQNHHGGMVLLNGHLYGGHGHNKGEPFCLDLRSGKVLWKINDSAVRSMKSASFACADGHLYIRYENGTMKLAEASTRGYVEKGSFRIPNDNRNSWQHPVVSGGKLYLRAQNVLHCYEVKGRG